MGNICNKVPQIQIKSQCCENNNSTSYTTCKRCGSKIKLSELSYTKTIHIDEYEPIRKGKRA